MKTISKEAFLAMKSMVGFKVIIKYHNEDYKDTCMVLARSAERAKKQFLRNNPEENYDIIDVYEAIDDCFDD